ncbi:hypothetical protein [Flexithrix dorotheae]|uniref:hypothetical protein n=1 Tax=Flexithrix dorotheae TaxID=70993 RepID=UPI0003720D0B|nr:hypothetical protein [Flexithrix dorotheae]
MSKLQLSINILIILFLHFFKLNAQPVPAEDENISFLVTFGANAPKAYGDDDHCQVFFFSIPATQVDPVYFRIFDPDTGGENDELFDYFDTQTRFSLYGGKGAYSNEAAQNIDPVSGFKSGYLLDTKTFGVSAKYDNNWFTFGPFNPKEGEFIEELGGYVFKLIAEGISGNDGNLYTYYLSTEGNLNKRVEGGNAFTFEYTFRLYDNPKEVSHLYPYVDERVISIKQHNFDHDNDGLIRVISVAKNGVLFKSSREGQWATSTHEIYKEEHNTSLDIQFIKSQKQKKLNNNIVFYMTNQYGESLPFYTIPIGGVPKFKYKITVKRKGRN